VVNQTDRLRLEFAYLFSDLAKVAWPVGWGDLIAEGLSLLGKAVKVASPSSPSFAITRMREHYGELEITTTTSPFEMRVTLQAMRIFSSATCQVCGSPATRLSYSNWWITLCPQHARERSVLYDAGVPADVGTSSPAPLAPHIPNEHST
jgi:hypothetical protein